MADRIPRKNRYVENLVQYFEMRLVECEGDVAAFTAALTSSERRTIATELIRCSGPDPVSMRYFLENYFVINTKGGDNDEDGWGEQQLQTVYPFKESQEIVWEDVVYCWEHRLRMWWIMLKARQVSWSTIVQGMLFQRGIFNELMNILYMADEMDRATQVSEMSWLAYRNLPFWMRPEKQYDNRGKGIVKFDRKDETARINNPGLNSTFFIDAANKPTGAIRGFTLHGAHMSEVGTYLRPQIITSDVIPALAKRNPLVIVAVEGTAKLIGHGDGGKFYQRMWDAAYRGKGLFRPLFCAWYREKAYCKPFPSTLEASAFAYFPEEAELISKVHDDCGFVIRPEQMAWYREQAEQFEATEGDRDKMEQEYPSYPKSAFQSGGICAFPRKVLAQIGVRDVRPPIWYGDVVFRKIAGSDKEELRFVTYGPNPEKSPSENRSMMAAAPLWLWEWPDNKTVYYIGSDPSQGIPGKDNSAMQLFRVPMRPGERIRQCVEYQGYADPRMLSKIVCGLGYMYNTAQVAPECNTLTEHINNILKIHEYPSIYRFRRFDKTTGQMTNFWGWETNHKSREDLIARFKTLMVEGSTEMKSSRLLDECATFVDDGTGRFEAPRGSHDDTLFAAMICIFCIMTLDPSLFEQLEQPLPDKSRDFANTDYSVMDEDTDSRQTDYAML